jgi:hypothetical protein
MFIYGTFDGYSNKTYDVGFFNKISYGNIGFPEALCEKHLIASTDD